MQDAVEKNLADLRRQLAESGKTRDDLEKQMGVQENRLKKKNRELEMANKTLKVHHH